MRTRIVPFLLLVLAALLGSATHAVAQKRALTHDDYDQWQSLGGRSFSPDGGWVAYTINPSRGDGTLHVQQVEGDIHYTHERGTGAQWSADGRFLAFRIEPTFADKIAAEWKRSGRGGGRGASAGGRGGRRFGRFGAQGPSATHSFRGGSSGGGGESSRDRGPEPEFAVMDLADGSVEMLEDATNFAMAEEGAAFLAYMVEEKKGDEDKDSDEKDEAEAEGVEKGGEAAEASRGERRGRGRRGRGRGRRGRGAGAEETEDEDEEETPDYLKDGKTLVVRNLATGEETRVPGVTNYGLTTETGFLYVVQNSEEDDEQIERGLHVHNLATGARTTLVAGAANYRGFALNRDESRMVFFSDRADRDAEEPRSDVYAWDFVAPQAAKVVSSTETTGFPTDRRVATGVSLQFSMDGQVLMLGAEEMPEEDLPKVLASEKVTLDLWHWKDPLLQPMQEKQARQLRSTALHCAFHFDSGLLCMFGKGAQDQVRFLTPDGGMALVQDSQPYAQEVSWDGRYSDVYVANTVTGERRKVLGHVGGQLQSSPGGRYLLVFEDPQWHCVDLARDQIVNLTESLPVRFDNEIHDTPNAARPHGVAGWTPNDEAVLIYDRYDVWKFAPDGSGASCVTEGYGRAQRIRFRVVQLDTEAEYLPTDESMMLSAFDTETMASGFYRDRIDGLAKPRKLVMEDVSFGGRGAGVTMEGDRLFFTKTTFRDNPDLWVANLEMGEQRRLTKLNPQQDDIRWGTAEHVRWTNADGVELMGYLVKPDGFDPSKQYPMMVYFYERNAENLHRYSRPGPGTSPNAAYYVSNGYLWFVPDIIYRDGYPGESALKCIVSGVQSLIAKGFVQKDAIGAAGHSWGGYQTAYLVTKTNIFAAVESGAPVSNMTSAYGGIRWQTGMSRAFQYERTQSRIGGSLWQYPVRFLENSPIFFADKVETPVLMLHNDEDGAVPWYQGIEYFCALRRLNKEVYMFNYVGEAHGLRKRQNQVDWTMRMQQYFDHHLKGAPAPEWMEEGVSFVDRDREKFRFNPPTPEPEEEKEEKKKPEVRTEAIGEPQAGTSGSGS